MEFAMGSENNCTLQKSKSRRRAYLRPAYVIARVIREARTTNHDALRRGASLPPGGVVLSSRRRASIRFYLVILLTVLALAAIAAFRASQRRIAAPPDVDPRYWNYEHRFITAHLPPATSPSTGLAPTQEGAPRR